MLLPSFSHSNQEGMSSENTAAVPDSPLERAVGQAIEIMEKNGSSGRNLLLLQVPDTCFRTEAMKLLHQIDPSVLSPDFHRAAEGILSRTPLSKKDPHAFKVGRSMEKTWEQFRKMLESKGVNPNLAQPFVFQTSGGQGKDDFARNSLFWFYQFHEDAMLRMAFMSGTDYEVHHGPDLFPVLQTYENPKDLDGLQRITCFMLDVEVVMSALNDETGKPRLTQDEVELAIRKVPGQLARRMHELGVIEKDSVLTIVVKKKSRAVKNDTKVSFHFKVDVAGLREQHMHVVWLLFKNNW